MCKSVLLPSAEHDFPISNGNVAVQTLYKSDFEHKDLYVNSVEMLGSEQATDFWYLERLLPSEGRRSTTLTANPHF